MLACTSSHDHAIYCGHVLAVRAVSLCRIDGSYNPDASVCKPTISYAVMTQAQHLLQLPCLLQVAMLLDDYSMVSFVPLDVSNDER